MAGEQAALLELSEVTLNLPLSDSEAAGLLLAGVRLPAGVLVVDDLQKHCELRGIEVQAALRTQQERRDGTIPVRNHLRPPLLRQRRLGLLLLAIDRICLIFRLDSVCP